MFLSTLDVAVVQTILKNALSSPVQVNGILDALTVSEYETWAKCNLSHTQSLAFPNRSEGFPSEFLNLYPQIDIGALVKTYG